MEARAREAKSRLALSPPIKIGDAMESAAFNAWVEQARAVPIEDELARRGFHLRGKIERTGPCPVCGGDDRFSINTEKQVWNCRGCGKGGDVIDLARHIDG